MECPNIAETFVRPLYTNFNFSLGMYLAFVFRISKEQQQQQQQPKILRTILTTTNQQQQPTTTTCEK